MPSTTDRPTTRASDTAGDGGDWRAVLGRVGLVARGVFHGALGWLALQFAIGEAGSGSVSAVSVFDAARARAGTPVVVVLVVGLAVLALWNVLRAVAGDPVSGSSAWDRVTYGVKGATYGAVAALGATSLTGGSSGGDQEEQATRLVFDLPGGVWLVGLAGLATVVYGVHQLRRNVLDTEFLGRLSTAGMSAATRDAVERAGRVGYAARGVSISLIGFFLAAAAVQHDPSETVGIGGALVELSREAHGRWVLGAVAIGLLGFGVLSLAEARYRRDH